MAAGAVAGLVACASGSVSSPGSEDARPTARSSGNVSFEVPDWAGRWYKGNTHTHTTESDGDSPPEYVARWYRDHGYDFLVLSDHNVFTDPAAFRSIRAEALYRRALSIRRSAASWVSRPRARSTGPTVSVRAAARPHRVGHRSSPT